MDDGGVRVAVDLTGDDSDGALEVARAYREDGELDGLTHVGFVFDFEGKDALRGELLQGLVLIIGTLHFILLFWFLLVFNVILLHLFVVVLRIIPLWL